MDAIVPAGWYADPAARHDQRYWDGLIWTTHVVDHGVASEDSLTASQGSVSAAAVSAWRYMVAVGAAVFLLVALTYEAIASLNLFLVTQRIGPDSLLPPFFAWMYDRLEVGFRASLVVAYPPILLWIFLPTATFLLSRVYIHRANALRTAGLALPGLFGGGEKKARWSNASSRLKSTGVRLFRRSQRVYLLLGGLASLGVAVVSGNAILNQLTGMNLGFGPWICLAAGAIGCLAAVLVWPWGRQTSVVVHADGSVTTEG